MILRVGRGHIKPGGWDAYEALYRRILAEGNQPPGLAERWLLRDLDDENGGFTLARWNTAEAASEWLESDNFEHVQDEMRQFFVGDYQVRTCDVRVHKQFTSD